VFSPPVRLLAALPAPGGNVAPTGLGSFSRSPVMARRILYLVDLYASARYWGAAFGGFLGELMRKRAR
jgi:hypothetical protein